MEVMVGEGIILIFFKELGMEIQLWEEEPLGVV